MPAQIQNIARTRFFVESTFGADATGTIGDGVDLRLNSIEAPGLMAENIPVDTLHPFRDQKQMDEFGFERGELSCEGDLVSTNNAAVFGATVTQAALAKLFEQMLGGYSLGGSGGSGAGSAVASGASASGVTVTAAGGSRFDALGALIGVETGVASGRYEITSIKTRSTDAITFARDLSFSPAVGARIIRAQNLYPTDQPTGKLQFLVELGRDRDNLFLYRGMQGTLAFSWALGGKLTWSAQFQVTKCVQDDDIATPQGGSSMSVYSVTGSSALLAKEGSITFNPAGATTRIAPEIAEFSFDPGMSWTETGSFNGTEGRSGFEAPPWNPTAKITVPHADETYDDARVAQTPYRLIAQAGVFGGKIIGLELPYVQIQKVTPKRLNALLYDELTLKCLADASLADQSDDLRRRTWNLGML